MVFGMYKFSRGCRCHNNNSSNYNYKRRLVSV